MILFWHPIIAQYIDPGTGSYLFQLAIAGLAAFMFFFSFKLKGFFKRIFSSFKKHEPAE